MTGYQFGLLYQVDTSGVATLSTATLEIERNKINNDNEFDKMRKCFYLCVFYITFIDSQN